MSGLRRRRPSEQAIAPADVTDILLWRLAVDVATAHQPRSDGRCGNLRCTGETNGPCAVFRQAQQALRAARTPEPASTAARTPTPVPVPPPTATDARDRNRFAGWFTAARAAVTRRAGGLPRPHWPAATGQAA